MAQSGSWFKVDFCDVHLTTCDTSTNVKVYQSTETKGDREKARTFTDIVQDFGFSKGTHVNLRSQHDPPVGSEPRHFSGKIFVRTPTEIPGTSSSGMETGTKPVMEPIVVPSVTKFKDPMSAMDGSSEPKPSPETDGTHDACEDVAWGV